MHFATAGIEVAPWIPLVVAFVISFFTSMGGVSGAFLLLPFQMSFLGYTSPSVSGTNQLFNIVAIPSGVYSYWREKRMVWPLTLVVIAGTLPGVLIGAIVRVRHLPDPKNFKVFAASILLYIGIRMIRDLFRRRLGALRTSTEKHTDTSGSGGSIPQQESPGNRGTSTVLTSGTARKSFNFGWTFTYLHRGECFTVPVWSVFLLSLVVGVIGGIYGIGGGAIIAPFLVTFLNLPVHTIAGASLMGTFVTSVAGVVFYQAMAPFYPEISVAPDYPLGILFGIGGMAGMYLGARCQKHVPATAIKWMLAAIIIFTALKYISDFFI